MFTKIKKFFEETAVEVQSELDEEEYLAAYDTTAGKILRGEEVTCPEESGLDQCACSDPVQRGILDALEDFSKIELEIKRKTTLFVAETIQAYADTYLV